MRRLHPRGTPTILGFVENPTTGALTPIPGSNPKGGFSAGVFPSAIAIDPTGKYVYVTDKAQNQVYGYGISNNTSGALTGLVYEPIRNRPIPGVDHDRAARQVCVRRELQLADG